MKVLVEKENIYFWRDMPTFTSLIQAHFYMTYSRIFIVSLENNYPWREEKKCLHSLYFALWYWDAFI